MTLPPPHVATTLHNAVTSRTLIRLALISILTAALAGASVVAVDVNKTLRAEHVELVATVNEEIENQAQTSANVETAHARIIEVTTAADGRTLDNASIVTADLAAETARDAIAMLKKSERDAAATLKANTFTDTVFWWDYENAKKSIGEIDFFASRDAAADAISQAEAAEIAVEAAITAWETEQARIAAARAEAERQAQLAAERAAASQRGGVLSGDSRAIANAVFARFGFTNVHYNTERGAGHYGATDLNNQIIYMDLRVIPRNLVASVAIHEYMHILQSREYGGYTGMLAHYGSMSEIEKAADRMAVEHGATWTNYI